MALWGAVLGGANLIYHAAGWQEGGLTASFEKFILDVEMLQNMMEFLRPMRVRRRRARLRCDQGGADRRPFLRRRAYHGALRHGLLPADAVQLAELRKLAGGRRPRRARSGRRELWQQALRDYEEPVMDPAIREELDAYVARRREAIGAGEP